MLRALFIALVSVFALWSAYWYIAATAIEQGMSSMLESWSSNRSDTQGEVLQVSGYPTSFILQTSDLRLGEEETLIWTSSSLRVDAASYAPHRISADISGPQQIHFGFGGINASSSDTRLRILLQPDYKLPLASVELSFSEAHVSTDADWAMRLEDSYLSLQHSESAGVYNAQLEIAALNLSSLFPDLPETHQLVHAMRASADLAFSRALDRTLFDAGMPNLTGINLSDFVFSLGASNISLTGQLAVTESKNISGVVILSITQWRDLLLTFRQAGYIDPDIADFFSEFASDGELTGQIDIPLEIRDGEVRFGMMTIGLLSTLP